jgi:hypothetical protein
MKKTNIYGLYSTRNNTIRYVGKSNNPKSRLKDHIWSSMNTNNNTYKSCWIRKEITDGYQIKYKILETCNLDEWVTKEIDHISKYENLTNHHKGGLGGSPIKYNKTYDELKKWVDDHLPKTINSIKKWKKYIKNNLINDIPLNPNKIYHNNGWRNWADFLNTANYKHIEYVSYDEFKEWVIKNVKTYKEFKKIKKPLTIPSHPERIYNENWIGWIGVLNDATLRNKSLYWSYTESKQFLNLTYGNITVSKFRELCKKNELPLNIPKKPERIYENFNYKEFLKLNYEPFLEYEKAKAIVINFNLKNNLEWRQFKKNGLLPRNIPKTPELYYKNWVSWYDWLGTTPTNPI